MYQSKYIGKNDFLEFLRFIHQNQFLYAQLNVEFFSAKIYERIDKEWLKFMTNLSWPQLNRLPIDFAEYQDCPTSLAEFFSQAISNSLANKFSTKFQTNFSNATSKFRRVKPKKAHELAAMVQFIEMECKRANIDRIVDIGCGLGHLGRYLKSNDAEWGSKIEYVGIEANPEFCHSGQKIDNDIKFKNICFSEENIEQCREIFTEKFHRTAIVSLHGCGELQRLILTEFAQIANAQSNPLLITIGCCYHKVKDWENTAVERWMLSKRMLEMFKQIFGSSGFPIPGLRLACQAKLPRWTIFTEEVHQRHQRAFSNRAFVECLKHEMEYGNNWSAGRLRKLNRQLGTGDTEFREEVLRRSVGTDCSPERRQQCAQMLDAIIDAHSHAIPFIEPFTCLQFALQAPLESFILLDRLFFLEEQAFNAELVELFDPLLSPRNTCIVGRIGGGIDEQTK